MIHDFLFAKIIFCTNRLIRRNRTITFGQLLIGCHLFGYFIGICDRALSLSQLSMKARYAQNDHSLLLSKFIFSILIWYSIFFWSCAVQLKVQLQQPARMNWHTVTFDTRGQWTKKRKISTETASQHMKRFHICGSNEKQWKNYYNNNNNNKTQTNKE